MLLQAELKSRPDNRLDNEDIDEPEEKQIISIDNSILIVYYCHIRILNTRQNDSII